MKKYLFDAVAVSIYKVMLQAYFNYADVIYGETSARDL